MSLYAATERNPRIFERQQRASGAGAGSGSVRPRVFGDASGESVTMSPLSYFAVGCSGDDGHTLLTKIRLLHASVPDNIRNVLDIPFYQRVGRAMTSLAQGDPDVIATHLGDGVYPETAHTRAEREEQARKFYINSYGEFPGSLMIIPGNHEHRVHGMGVKQIAEASSGMAEWRSAVRDVHGTRPHFTGAIDFGARIIRDSSNRLQAVEIFLNTTTYPDDIDQQCFGREVHRILRTRVVEGDADLEFFTVAQAQAAYDAPFKLISAHHTPFFAGDNRSFKSEAKRHGDAKKVFEGSQHMRLAQILEEQRIGDFFGLFHIGSFAHQHVGSVAVPALSGDSLLAQRLPKVILIQGNAGAVSNKQQFYVALPGQVDATSLYAGFYGVRLIMDSSGRRVLITNYDCIDTLQDNQIPKVLSTMEIRLNFLGLVIAESFVKRVMQKESRAQLLGADLARDIPDHLSEVSLGSGDDAPVVSPSSRRDEPVVLRADESLVQLSKKLYQQEKQFLRYCLHWMQLAQGVTLLPFLLACQKTFLKNLQSVNSQMRELFLETRVLTEPLTPVRLLALLDDVMVSFCIRRVRLSVEFRQLALMRQLLAAIVVHGVLRSPRSFSETIAWLRAQISEVEKLPEDPIEKITILDDEGEIPSPVDDLAEAPMRPRTPAGDDGVEETKGDDDNLMSPMRPLATEREERESALSVGSSVIAPFVGGTPGRRSGVLGISSIAINAEQREGWILAILFQAFQREGRERLRYALAYPESNVDYLRRFMLAYLVANFSQTESVFFSILRAFLEEASDLAVAVSLESEFGVKAGRNEIDSAHKLRLNLLFQERALKQLFSATVLATNILLASGLELIDPDAVVRRPTNCCERLSRFFSRLIHGQRDVTRPLLSLSDVEEPETHSDDERGMELRGGEAASGVGGGPVDTGAGVRLPK